MSFTGRYSVCLNCLAEWIQGGYGPEIGAKITVVEPARGCDIGLCDA